MADSVARKRSKFGPVRGDVVRVRSAEEILATLDGNGALEALPFMPEMLKFCGQEIQVGARADKTCDTVEWTGHRMMKNTVFLTNTRCDGSAHSGCQAGCNLFWREEWLEYADEPGQPIATPSHEPAPAKPIVTIDTLLEATRAAAEEDAYRCQATEHFRASAPYPRHRYIQYVEDVRTGNASVAVVLRGLLIFVFNKYQNLSERVLPRWLRIRGGREWPWEQGTGSGGRTPAVPLEVGDLVEIRSKDEIMATLGSDNRNRGMWYDAEMSEYCGRRARVKRVVNRILDEKTGKMIKLSDCVVLEEVVCLGLYHRFCQRAITPYWRSAWLRKIDETVPMEQAAPRREHELSR